MRVRSLVYFNAVLFLRWRGCFVSFFWKTKQFVNDDDGSRFWGRPWCRRCEFWAATKALMQQLDSKGRWTCLSILEDVTACLGGQRSSGDKPACPVWPLLRLHLSQWISPVLWWELKQSGWRKPSISSNLTWSHKSQKHKLICDVFLITITDLICVEVILNYSKKLYYLCFIMWTCAETPVRT